MKDFEGVMPLHFNAIIKNGEKASEYNLKVWLSNDKKVFENIWPKIKRFIRLNKSLNIF